MPQPPQAGGALVDLAREFSPRVEVAHDWLVLLDVSGLERMMGVRASGVGRSLEPTPSVKTRGVPSGGGAPLGLRDADPAMVGNAIGLELGRAALERGWAPRVAVAPTRVAALLLAQARPGLTVVPPGEEARQLAPLPIAVLEGVSTLSAGGAWDSERGTRNRRRRGGASRHYRLAPGPLLEQVQSSRFRRWGLRTLGELAALPPADLAARLGPDGPALQRLARGEDPRPLVPVEDPERFEASFDLEWPIEGLEPLSFVLARLLEPLCARLERADRGAAGLTTRLVLTTRDAHVRTLPLPAPIRDPRVLRTLVLLDLESHPPPAGIDRVTVSIEPTPGRVTQFSLIEYPRPSPEQLSTLLARLGALVGETRAGAPALVDSHRPGAFAMVPFAPDRDGGTDPERTRNGPGTHTKQGTNVVRRFRVPIVARVTVECGRPVRMTTGRRGLAGGRVEQAAGPWRTSGAWWESAGVPTTPWPWDRDEWDVVAADGVVYRIFQDHARGDRWFVEGIMD